MAAKVTELRPFDGHAACPKCDHDVVRTRYVGHIQQDPCWYERTYSPPGKWPEHEYMHRTCERCKYEWPEAALTQEGKP